MGRKRSRWRRALIAVAVLFALGVLAPFVCVLGLRFVDPPFTMVMLARAIDRWRADDEPAWPKRTVVPANAIAPSFVRAVLAAEDDAFYLHHGFDFAQLRRVFEERDSKPIRGASTISQQTAKNLFLWNGRSYVRKVIEAYMTVWLELLLPKDRILELYMNLIECGDGAFGVERCAKLYFGKRASQLSADESAAIASVLPSPLRYKIRGDYVAARVAELLPRMAIPAPKP